MNGNVEVSVAAALCRLSKSHELLSSDCGWKGVTRLPSILCTLHCLIVFCFFVFQPPPLFFLHTDLSSLI